MHIETRPARRAPAGIVGSLIVLAALACTVAPSGCASQGIPEQEERVAEINAKSEVTELISILRDNGVPLNRAAAAGALGRTGDASAVEPLIEGLQDTDAGVRRDCANALGAIADRRATSSLCKVLLYDHIVDVRRAAARALHDIKDEGAVESLIGALTDTNDSVVYNAHRALVEITGRTDLGRSSAAWSAIYAQR
jgi:HEAT repeat protein